jgi:hypothetical protein
MLTDGNALELFETINGKEKTNFKKIYSTPTPQLV